MKLYQVTEDDLETLESALPSLQDAMMSTPEIINRNDVQEHLAMVKVIISNIRWNYGPPTNVENHETQTGKRD